VAHQPDTPFDARITTTPAWGVVPFEVEFGLAVTSGTDSIVDVYWDFDGDGLIDTSGLAPTHVFSEPAAHEVVAQIATAANGTLMRSVTVEAHSAVMSITFDDGPESIYSGGYPLLASKGVVATVYVVTSWINGGSYLSWDELTRLQDAGWDIGSHSLTHKDLTKVDGQTLHFELSQSKAELQARGFPAKHFAVPYGACNWTVIAAVEQYYESCRGWKGFNPPLEQVDPYLLKWDVTVSWRPLDYYRQHMDSVMTYGGWYILNNHVVTGNCFGEPYCVTTQMLSDIVDYALEKRIKIMSVDEALASTSLEAGPGTHADRDVPGPDFPELSADRTCVGEFPVTVRFAVGGHRGVNVSIYDVQGRVVQSLADVEGVEGQASATWDGLNSYGVPVADGCYFCVLRTGGSCRLARKLVIVR
jgi:peptidoglycan/xylan/chitin deacetylase (PgdA/CDA1 family)